MPAIHSGIELSLSGRAWKFLSRLSLLCTPRVGLDSVLESHGGGDGVWGPSQRPVNRAIPPPRNESQPGLKGAHPVATVFEETFFLALCIWQNSTRGPRFAKLRFFGFSQFSRYWLTLLVKRDKNFKQGRHFLVIRF